MKFYDLLVNKIKDSQEFRLINAKDKVLDAAIYYLTGSTTDIEDYLYVFEQIENNASLNDEFEKELSSLNIKLNNTEDFKVPLTDEIEELCQKIRELGPSEDEQVSIWSAKIPIDELYFEESISFKEALEKFTNHIYYREKDIFKSIISYYKQNEKKKEIWIEQLDKELTPIKNIAENLLKNEEVDKNWGSQLQEICHTQAYANNFYHCFIQKRETILSENSIGLNEREKVELNAFFNELEIELG
jgi:hypothetical protein